MVNNFADPAYYGEPILGFIVDKVLPSIFVSVLTYSS